MTPPAHRDRRERLVDSGKQERRDKLLQEIARHADEIARIDSELQGLEADLQQAAERALEPGER